MNRVEHLLTCLAEEAGEIQVAVSKALRFGLWNHHPERETTNAQDIQIECCHLVAVREMLEATGIITENDDLHIFAKKKCAIEKYMQLAEECGTLQKEEPPLTTPETCPFCIFNDMVSGKCLCPDCPCLWIGEDATFGCTYFEPSEQAEGGRGE